MRTACSYNWHKTGKQVFWDKATYETLHANFPIYFYDDFLGADLVIPAFGSDESGCKWVYKDVSLAGSPSCAKAADTVNGFVSCALDAQIEVQTIQLNMDDQLAFSIAQGLIFEARVSCTTLPTASAARAIFGVGGAWVDVGPNVRVGFEILTAGVINAECDDNVTDTSANTGVTAVASTYNIYRIDCTSQTNIKFFINGARVCRSTTFNNAAAAADSKVQPYFGMVKTANAATGTLPVDYVKIWCNRS